MAARMRELQFGGMQEISWKGDAGTGFWAAFTRSTVKSVANHGMADRSEVYANLVGTAGFDFYFEQGEFAKGGVDSLLDLVVGDRFTATGSPSCHACASHHIATDRSGNCATLIFRGAVNERDVSLFNFPS